MMEAARTSETLVNVYQTHGATTQTTAILVVSTIEKKSSPLYELESTN
jgi:hypothetical protein